MKRLVIAVDCDDVLVPTTPFFVEYYNQKYGTNVALAEAHIDSDDIWGVSHDEMLERFGELMLTDAYRTLGPSEVEVAVLTELAKHHELHLVTARKEHERQATQEMLDTQLPGVFTSMEFVGWNGSKGEVCKQLGADVLVDDSSRHLHNAIELGLSRTGAILFGDYAWNETSHSHDDLTHCADWPAVKKVIDALASQDEHANK
ncbi:MAG: hypothetical protein WAQ27_03080 [Candidatus Microsaccharimonas sp.]